MFENFTLYTFNFSFNCIYKLFKSVKCKVSVRLTTIFRAANKSVEKDGHEICCKLDRRKKIIARRPDKLSVERMQLSVNYSGVKL